ncbi:SDR family NAD(P)-dependent oxidoreductase [Leisingera thetidis]|uniref:SDR family NAD(P)-dependent oxidoreductase n=1 Tax=Leisingera thetidis TaxID=2930199 RepID=UPI0021F7CE1E|nr:SDR family NAD(P)-dependent oxidoreductase [Leisingera thetidis]
MNTIVSPLSDAAPVAANVFLPEQPEDSALRAALLKEGAADAWVRRRRCEDGQARRVAFVATRRAISLPGPQAAILVPLNRLPRTGSGQVDQQALAALHIPDSAGPMRLVKNVPVLGPGWLGSSASQQPPEQKSGRPALLDGGTAAALRAGIRTLADILADAAVRVPARGVTLLSRDAAPHCLTYQALDAGARRAAGALQAAGMQPGAAVLCVFRDNEDAAALTAIWGAIYAGLRPVPLLAPRRYDTDEAQARRLRDASELLPEAVILAGRARAEIGTLLPGRTVLDLAVLPEGRAITPVPCDPDAPAAYFLTSGSTARPKVVPQTHQAILTLVAGCAGLNDLGSEDISLNWLPMDHVGSFIMLHMRDAYLGARQIRAAGADVLRDPLIWLDWMSEYRVTNGWAPNFAFELVISAMKQSGARGWDLSALRFLHNGGEAVIRDTAAAFLRSLSAFGIGRTVVRPAWGMSETSSGCVFNPDFDPLGAAEGPIPVGRPCPGLRVRITDPARPDKLLCEGETGLLQVSGPMVLREYDRDPEKTRESFAGPGWFDTGDLGRIEDGKLFLTGRRKDVIIVNGLNQSPAEIETRVSRIAGVRPSCTAVLSVAGQTGGPDRIAVFFVPQDTHGAQPVAQAIRRVLSAELGLSADLIFALQETEVPKTSIGKIQKEKLRQAVQNGALLPVWASSRRGPRTIPPLVAPGWVKCPAAPLPGPAAATLCGPGSASCAQRLAELGLEAGEVSPQALAGREIGIVSANTLVLLPGLLQRPEQAVPILQEVARICLLQPMRLIWIAPGSGLGAGCCAPVSMLTALLRSAEAETPGLAVRIVDPGRAGLDLERLRDEIRDPACQTEIRWTAEGRELLQHHPVQQPQGPGVGIRRGGRYLITGGLGGIGQLLCRYLQDRYGARLTILGRRGEQELAPPARDALKALRLQGDVRYEACDLTHPAAGAVLGKLACDGIFHLAGLAAAVPVSELSPAHMAGQMQMAQVKISGTEALVNSAAQAGAGWIVAFGSVAGSFGGARYGVYAMANRYQQARAGRPGGVRMMTLNWSMWENTGLSAGIAGAGLAAQHGYTMLEAETAFAAMEQALQSGLDTVDIGVDAQSLAMTPHLQAPAVPLQDTGAQPHRAQPDGTSGAGSLAAGLCAIWQQILNLTGLPSCADSIFDLGATSLDLPRAQERIAQETGRDFDLLDLFDHPVIGDFAASLA